MRLLKGKKGQLLLYGLIFGIIAGIIIAYLSNVKDRGDFDVIGSSSFYLIDASNRAEKILFYIDQSAKYALEQSIYDLAKSGGVFEVDEHSEKIVHECGKYGDAYVWFEIRKDGDGYAERDCVKEGYVNDNLKLIFNEHLNEYLASHPDRILADNYEYSIAGNVEITGKAIYPLKFKISDTPEARIDLSATSSYESFESLEGSEYVSPVTTKPGIPVSLKYRLEGVPRSKKVAIDTVVLHHTGDDKAYKTYNTLKARGLSVHYIVDRDGTIYYVVDESKVAYHAANWNSRSIGIEIVNTGKKNMQFTEAQYAAIKNLLQDISKRWPSVKLDDRHIVAHYQVSSIGKWDPSPNFDWKKIGLPQHSTLAQLGKSPPKEAGFA